MSNERRIRISYQVVTEESAEIGDYAETGWIDEEGVCIDPTDYVNFAEFIDAAVSIIGNDCEASDYPRCCPGHTWYTECDGDTDYSDGSVTTQSFHLDGFTAEEEWAIYSEITGRPVPAEFAVAAGGECAHCGDDITDLDDCVSSPHGSMHAACAEENESENPDQW